MKFFPPVALAFLLTACAVTPEDQQAAHQRQLEKQARENFIALKAQEHPDHPVVLHDDLPPPTPKPGMFSFLGGQSPAPAPRPKTNVEANAQPPPLAPPQYAAANPQTKATPTPAPRYAAFSRQKAPRNPDDTVYYWQVAPPSSHLQATPRQLAAEGKYARFLAKRPEDLSPEERLWAHEHY
jgi:DNA polymerase-3 subunit gamma/tau